MSQTVGAFTFRKAKVELSRDGSTWIDVSGSSSAVGTSGGDRPVIEYEPLFSDTTKAKTGARERVTIVVKSVYTEIDDEAFDLLDTAYQANAEIGMRWTPLGGDVSGAKRYSAIGAKIKKPAYPGGEVSDPKPLMAEYELSAEYIHKETT
jgi:hypothetical protein